MTTYFVTWLSVLCLGFLAQKSDYFRYAEYTTSRVSHRKNAVFFYNAAAFLLIFVSGCRYYIGSDYYAYYGWYNSYANSLPTRLLTLDEPGISLIYYIVVKFIDDGAACVFVADAIMIWILLKTMRNNTDQLFLSVTLYALICWTATFNGMRQALAAAVLFCGFPAIRDRKLTRFCLCVFAAYLFHKSSLIFLPVYFIAYRKVNLKNVLILAIAAFLFLQAYDRLFHVAGLILEKDLNLNSAYSSRAVNILRVLSNVAPAAYFLLIYSKKEKSTTEELYLNLLILHAFISVITSNSAYLARVNMYTAPFVVISICELLKGDRRNRSVVTMGIVVLYFIFQTYEVGKSPDLSPFRWIWERII